MHFWQAFGCNYIYSWMTSVHGEYAQGMGYLISFSSVFLSPYRIQALLSEKHAQIKALAWGELQDNVDKIRMPRENHWLWRGCNSMLIWKDASPIFSRPWVPAGSVKARRLFVTWSSQLWPRVDLRSHLTHWVSSGRLDRRCTCWDAGKRCWRKDVVAKTVILFRNSSNNTCGSSEKVHLRGIVWNFEWLSME